jgi:hypothetical protein
MNLDGRTPNEVWTGKGIKKKQNFILLGMDCYKDIGIL